MKTTHTLLVMLMAASHFGCSGSGFPEPALPEGFEAAADSITQDFLRDSVAALSDDRLAGRGPGTDGDRMARQLLARKLEEIGLTPGAPGGNWEQPFPIAGLTSHMPESWSFRSTQGDAAAFRWWDEYIAASGFQHEEISIENAEVVFVGYGIEAPEESWDDFKGTDLEGKILLMLNSDPDWHPDLFGGKRRLYYGRWTYKYESAARQGAAGAIIVHTRPSAGYPWPVVQTSWSGEQFELPAGDDSRVAIQAWLTEEAAKRLVALGGQGLDDLVEAARKRDFRPVPLGVTTSIRFAVDVTLTETANVAGLITGSDPDLSREVVIYSAHHDHLGVGKADETGDRIYNGALDNAVAMAQALAVARAIMSLPERPRRSILFLFVGAEEQGLLGSKHYSQNPTFPPGRIAANINLELGNIWGRTRDVAVFGKGKSNLEDLLATLANRQNRRLVGEATPDEGWYYRSDQLSFARIGVPAIWFKSGTDFIGEPSGWGDEIMSQWIESHYHRPNDEIEERWTFDGLVEDARLAFMLGLSVANADQMPAWRPGDEFEDQRRAALEALR